MRWPEFASWLQYNGQRNSEFSASSARSSFIMRLEVRFWRLIVESTKLATDYSCCGENGF
jgi:hypothetical protein